MFSSLESDSGSGSGSGSASGFDFFYDNGFYELGLNIEEIEGINQHSAIFETSLYDKSVAFYSRLFKLYQDSDKHMGIREFDRCLDAILRNPGTLDIKRLSTNTHQNIPFGIISVDYNGNFSTFSPELIGQPNTYYNNFIFGNVLNNAFFNLKSNRILKELAGDINKGIKKCKKEREFFHLCGGGAPANKFFENGSFNSSETNYCKYNVKIPTELVLNYLEEKLNISN